MITPCYLLAPSCACAAVSASLPMPSQSHALIMVAALQAMVTEMTRKLVGLTLKVPNEQASQ